jgi:hypothetical protein
MNQNSQSFLASKGTALLFFGSGDGGGTGH